MKLVCYRNNNFSSFYKNDFLFKQTCLFSRKYKSRSWSGPIVSERVNVSTFYGIPFNGIEERKGKSPFSILHSRTLSDLSRICGRRWNCYLTTCINLNLRVSVALHPAGNQTSLLSTRRMCVRCWSFARLLEIIIPRIYPVHKRSSAVYVRLPMLHASENSFERAGGVCQSYFNTRRRFL